MIPPLSTTGFAEEFQDELRENLPLPHVWVSVHERTMCLTANHYFIGKHGALRSRKVCGVELFSEGHWDSACFKQTEYIAGSRGCPRTLAREKVVLGPISGGDVVLGMDNDHILYSRMSEQDFRFAFSDLLAQTK